MPEADKEIGLTPKGFEIFQNRMEYLKANLAKCPTAHDSQRVLDLYSRLEIDGAFIRLSTNDSVWMYNLEKAVQNEN